MRIKGHFLAITWTHINLKNEVSIHHIQTPTMFILQWDVVLWRFFLLNFSRLIYLSMTSQVFVATFRTHLFTCFNYFRAKLYSLFPCPGSPASCLVWLKSLLSKLESNTSVLQDDVLQMSKVARTGLHPDWSTKRKSWAWEGFQNHVIFQICWACQEKVT